MNIWLITFFSTGKINDHCVQHITYCRFITTGFIWQLVTNMCLSFYFCFLCFSSRLLQSVTAADVLLSLGWSHLMQEVLFKSWTKADGQQPLELPSMSFWLSTMELMITLSGWMQTMLPWRRRHALTPQPPSSHQLPTYLQIYEAFGQAEKHQVFS